MNRRIQRNIHYTIPNGQRHLAVVSTSDLVDIRYQESTQGTFKNRGIIHRALPGSGLLKLLTEGFYMIRVGNTARIKTTLPLQIQTL
jgi:hypothetical protein